MGIKNPFDTIKTNKWSISCLDYRKKQGFIFGLQNLQTGRAHKLIFIGAGTKTINNPSLWSIGIFAIPFQTKYPVNFENFNNNMALLEPLQDAAQTKHKLTIGWLAEIVLLQSHGDEFGIWNFYGNCRIEYGSGEISPADKDHPPQTNNNNSKIKMQELLITSYQTSTGG